MHNTSSDDLRWLSWPADATVEYQIRDDFVRIRRWENGAANISEWLKWDESTDSTIRRQLRALAWQALPVHKRRVARAECIDRHEQDLYEWLRDHIMHPFAGRH
jgi:hypothetical protein